MYPTVKEFAAARAISEGAHHVPTPAIIVALRMLPQAERTPTPDTWWSDMTTAQVHIDTACGDFKSRLKRAL